jgi:pSer/pThr/pTyr-binding forkhead associated (FHA) protein
VADRQLYDRVTSDGLVFPEGRDAVTLAVAGPELLIGRRHEGRGIEPAIDLSGPLADPAASHQHALLTRLEDGDYTVTDLGSTNGTALNDGRVAIEPGQPHRLVDGDRIHIGAWTTIIVRRLPS